jgi:cytoskeletal protein CcmA (bactofilin family)
MAAFPWNKASEPSKQPARPADTEKSMSKGMESKLAPPAPPAAAAAQTAQGNACVLGPTLHFKGELYGEEDLEFQGQIEGSIEHTRSLSIGKEGGVTGNIKAKFVIVEGRVDGDIHATESVQVRQSAKVVGNIFAPRVGIAEGANFSGRVEMNHKATPAAQPRPQATLSDRAAETLLAKTAG